MTIDMKVSQQEFDAFLTRHDLPAAYAHTAERYFIPLANALPDLKPENEPLLLGINGAQGTGKSTLADFLRQLATSFFNWNVAVLSIDDFYYTRAERAVLGDKVHPLLATRGVPGTHDIPLLQKYLDDLRAAKAGVTISLPRFNKARDDRAGSSSWPVVQGPVDLILLEGWCVGSQPESAEALEKPVNTLERLEDSDGVWRRYVNEQLRECYSPVFARLNALVFLKAPSFAAVFRWRLEQEEKLRARSDCGSAGLMNEDQMRRFIQHYERITRCNLASLGERADVVFELGESHAVTSCLTTIF